MPAFRVAVAGEAVPLEHIIEEGGAVGRPARELAVPQTPVLCASQEILEPPPDPLQDQAHLFDPFKVTDVAVPVPHKPDEGALEKICPAEVPHDPLTTGIGSEQVPDGEPPPVPSQIHR